MTIENILWPNSIKECCRILRGGILRPSDHQSDVHRTEPSRPAKCLRPCTKCPDSVHPAHEQSTCNTWAFALHSYIIGLDKGIRSIFFLFLHKNICCGYSLEAPRRGASNEYPQHMFSWRNKKNINTFGLKKASYQELWYILQHPMTLLVDCVGPYQTARVCRLIRAFIVRICLKRHFRMAQPI